MNRRLSLGLNGSKSLEEDIFQETGQAHISTLHSPTQQQVAPVPATTATAGTSGADAVGTTTMDTGRGEEAADMGEEIAWGPAHPCFPHLNPHVPVNSKEYLTTRIIRVKRDWMIRGDLTPTFSNTYPEILEPALSEQEFRHIIATVNDGLIEAFDPFSLRNCIDATLGLLTGWLWEDIGAPAVKHRLRRIEAWLEAWNREIGSKSGVRIWSLRRTAYLSLDIQIPDPKVGIIQSTAPSTTASRPNTAGR